MALRGHLHFTHEVTLNSRSFIPVDGSTRLFTVPFPFLSTAHVKFLLNHIVQLDPLNYRWVGPTTVEFTDAPTSGTLEIRRETPITDALVRFQNGAALTEDELNLAVLQNLYISQETRDYYDALLNGALDKLVTTPGRDKPVLDQVVEDLLNSELLADLASRIGDIHLNAETINAQRIRLDTVEEVVEAITNVNGESIATFLLNEQSARIEGDTALAQDIRLIGAKSGDGLSFVLDLSKVKVSPTEALGTRLSGIDTKLGANTAAIATEQTARVNADIAITSEIQTLTAKVGDNLAAILTEQSARANADQALATSISAVATKTDNNAAAIQTETTARTSAITSLASQITTMQSTVGQQDVKIQTAMTAIDGVKGQYTVKIDNNGYVTGYGLASTVVNGTPTSAFAIRADRFTIVAPSGGARTEFSDGNWRIYDQNNVLRVRLGVW